MDLVTGATGFLGGHVVDVLRTGGAPIRILCRKPPVDAPHLHGCEIVLGDVLDKESVARAVTGAARVFHIAGRVDFYPDAAGRKRLFDVNESGTRHVMEAAWNARVDRVVHISSVSAIGPAPAPDRPLCEADFDRRLMLDHPYPKSKRAGELVALEFAARGLPVCIASPTFFSGPRDVNLSSARTIVSFLAGQVWFAPTRGGFGYTDVRDIAAGIGAVANRGAIGQRYILGGVNLSLREYHRLLSSITGLRYPIGRLPPWLLHIVVTLGTIQYRLRGVHTYVSLGDARLARHYWYYDYSKAKSDLGMSCRSPHESLVEAVECVRARLQIERGSH